MLLLNCSCEAQFIISSKERLNKSHVLTVSKPMTL